MISIYIWMKPSRILLLQYCIFSGTYVNDRDYRVIVFGISGHGFSLLSK